MYKIPLQHPIHTLEGQELVPAGITVTEEVVRGVIASNSSPTAKNMPLMQCGSIRNDMLQFFASPPYNTIFANPEDKGDIWNIMTEVNLSVPVLESLDYFREHDFHTYRHTLMVFALSTLLSKSLLPDYRRRIQHATAGPSHDMGKVCVPLKILMKSDPLTREERNILFQHSVAGYVLLSFYTGDMANFSAKVARDHHEHRDGSGYIRGVKLNDPMVEIFAVSDIYDALISPRPFRPVSFDNRSALEEVVAMAQRGQVNWEVVQVLVALNRKDKPDFRTFEVSHEKRGTPPPINFYGKTSSE